MGDAELGRVAPKGSGPGAGVVLYPNIVLSRPKGTSWRRTGRRPIPEEARRGRQGIRVWQPVCGCMAGHSGERGADGVRVSGSDPCPGAAANVPAMHGESVDILASRQLKCEGLNLLRAMGTGLSFGVRRVTSLDQSGPLA